jgi:signal transduction histidine kinase
MERPRISIRFRIILSFTMAFIFLLAMASGSMYFISRLDSRYTFFDEAGNFAFEIQQARRCEKNFFLYGAKSDLYDALSFIGNASHIIDTSTEIRSVLKPNDYRALSDDLKIYQDVLNELLTKSNSPGSSKNPRNPELENQLRTHGHNILSLAEDIVREERIKVKASTRSFLDSGLYLIGINFLVMLWMASELIRQILNPLRRFVGYTQRIALGDFTPITPLRKYRDEFSTLALAVNHMLYELQEKQEQLLQSRKMAAVGTLTAGIAHELNNPLNNISLTTEALLDGIDSYDDTQKRRMLQDIFTQVDRASGTVRNLLDFTRMDQSDIEPIDARSLVESSLNLVNNELQINHIEVITDYGENLMRILGNIRDLQQVFLNIFLNCIQAMPEGGVLNIQANTDTDARYVLIDIKDSGCGIPKENFEKIFDPFFTTKDVGKGTGLGLSVSYGIIQKHNGRIKVDSEIGKWTKFSVYLPVAAEEI